MRRLGPAVNRLGEEGNFRGPLRIATPMERGIGWSVDMPGLSVVIAPVRQKMDDSPAKNEPSGNDEFIVLGL
jgi:hypothetical protein